MKPLDHRNGVASVVLFRGAKASSSQWDVSPRASTEIYLHLLQASFSPLKLVLEIALQTMGRVDIQKSLANSQLLAGSSHIRLAFSAMCRECIVCMCCAL